MLRSGGMERARKSPICGKPLLNSDQLNCVPWALQCSTSTASSTQAPVTSQPRAVSGVLTIQRYVDGKLFIVQALPAVATAPLPVKAAHRQ
ncbi:hypothetical protein D3C77_640990 [compost metagenome]